MGIKIGMVSLGCAKNRVDAELMLGVLVKEGLQCVIIVPVVVLALIITFDGLKALRAKEA